MTCEIIRTDGDLIYARISGAMRFVDQQALQNAALRVIATGRKVRFLAFLENFQGWDKGDDWSDIGFLVGHGDDIAKMAIVGDPRLKDEVFAFVGRGFRATEIEFFPSDRWKEAEFWVRA